MPYLPERSCLACPREDDAPVRIEDLHVIGALLICLLPPDANVDRVPQASLREGCVNEYFGSGMGGENEGENENPCEKHDSTHPRDRRAQLSKGLPRRAQPFEEPLVRVTPGSAFRAGGRGYSHLRVPIPQREQQHDRDVVSRRPRRLAAGGGAIELFERCVAELERTAPDNDVAYIRLATFQSYALSEVGDITRAREVVGSALERAEGVADPDTRVRLYCRRRGWRRSSGIRQKRAQPAAKRSNRRRRKNGLN